MTLLFYSGTDREGRFESLFRQSIKTRVPGLEVRTWPNFGNAEDITYAALWLPPEGLFAHFPNLSHIFALSAGVDRLLSAPDLPLEVPVYRLQDVGMATPMAEYVLFGVLQAHRQMPILADAQVAKVWMRDALEPQAEDWHVGILGAGVLASAAAKRLTQNGYTVRTWSRSRKQIEGVTSYAGAAELGTFCKSLNTLVCLLPLTNETSGMLNADLFKRLPQGTSLINVARGEHCVDRDLIDALDSGQLSSALLDVFHQEPLPADHPFWTHPRVQMTPHISAPTQASAAANQVADNIANVENGRKPDGLVDRNLGY